jgi:hypothetical protein
MNDQAAAAATQALLGPPRSAPAASTIATRPTACACGPHAANCWRRYSSTFEGRRELIDDPLLGRRLVDPATCRVSASTQATGSVGIDWRSAGMGRPQITTRPSLIPTSNAKRMVHAVRGGFRSGTRIGRPRRGVAGRQDADPIDASSVVARCRNRRLSGARRGSVARRSLVRHRSRQASRCAAPWRADVRQRRPAMRRVQDPRHIPCKNATHRTPVKDAH